MSSDHCISYFENELIQFGDVNNHTINVIPMRHRPYLFDRKGYNRSEFDQYFSRKYEFIDPIKELEVCGPMVILVIELAKRLKCR